MTGLQILIEWWRGQMRSEINGNLGSWAANQKCEQWQSGSLCRSTSVDVMFFAACAQSA